MPASLCNLLSFSPSPPLPLPAKKEPFFSPPPATTDLPWRRLSRNRENGFLPLLHSPTEVASGSGVLRSCFPSLAWANVMFAKGGHYNVQVVVGEDEPEEMLLRRFRREVMKAGVIQECKRRRWFENTREKGKRKAREATRRTQKRRFQPKSLPEDKQVNPLKNIEEEEDNWELPEGELPYGIGATPP